MSRQWIACVSRLGLIASIVFASVGLAGCSSFDSKPTGRPVAFREEPDIRVRIKKSTLQTRIEGPSRMVIRPTTVVRAEAVTGPLSFRGTTNGMVMTDGTGRQREFAPGTDVEVLPREMTEAERRSSDGYKPGDALVIDGATHPGFALVHSKSGEGGVLDVIGVMPIETYVPGVISHELIATWPRQAFECQAVAARSYALHERERSRRAYEYFDVESNTSDQVYGGLSSLTVAVEATRATRGVVMTEGVSGPASKVLLRTYYSSTCGGEQASAKDVFPATGVNAFNLAKPLQAQKREHFCQSAGRYRWSAKRGDTELSRRLQAWGVNAGHPVKTIGQLTSCKVAERNITGRPVRYELTDDRNQVFKINAEQLRNACNFAAPGMPEITKETRVYSGDLEMFIASEDVIINGRGFGHGVGMCQYCAKGMAEKGWDWPAMMKLFYPGAGTMKAY